MSKPVTEASLQSAVGKSAGDPHEQWDEGLERISQIILTERRKLIPHPHILPKDTDRTDILWRENSRKGVLMSTGGVEESFLQSSDTSAASAAGFNGYRTDRAESVTLTSAEMKRFLAEEGLIAEGSDLNKLFVDYSLGGHEAYTRVIRSINSDQNNGVLYPIGGYGLIARATATTGYLDYEVHLVKVDRENGEKILVAGLEDAARKHPTAGTLYLESKTMCGAVYTKAELKEIVTFCKNSGIFLIFDSAHTNMEFSPANKFPGITKICQEQDYKDFAIIFTGSKTYGLERARIGFIIFGDEKLYTKTHNEFGKMIGSLSDQPFEVAKALISSSPDERRSFTARNAERHRFNMNLLIAYAEGIDSQHLDEDLKAAVAAAIPAEYHDGVNGLRLVYKPQGGIQLKVDMSEMENKFFGNVRMFNAEMFSYALHAATDVVTIHSYQVMDPAGRNMRLSFSVRNDIHQGMQKMHDFVNHALLDRPRPNKFMPGIELAEDYIFPSNAEFDAVVKASYDLSLNDKEKLSEEYRETAKSNSPPYVRRSLSKQVLTEAVNNSASPMQKEYRKYKQRHPSPPSGFADSTSPSSYEIFTPPVGDSNHNNFRVITDAMLSQSSNSAPSIPNAAEAKANGSNPPPPTPSGTTRRITCASGKAEDKAGGGNTTTTSTATSATDTAEAKADQQPSAITRAVSSSSKSAFGSRKGSPAKTP